MEASCGEQRWGLASKDILAGAGAGAGRRSDVCSMDTGRRDMMGGSTVYFWEGGRREPRGLILIWGFGGDGEYNAAGGERDGKKKYETLPPVYMSASHGAAETRECRFQKLQLARSCS